MFLVKLSQDIIICYILYGAYWSTGIRQPPATVIDGMSGKGDTALRVVPAASDDGIFNGQSEGMDNRLNFGRLKESASTNSEEDKPRQSSSVPNLRLTQRILSLGRNSSFTIRRQRGRDDSVAEDTARAGCRSLHGPAASLHDVGERVTKPTPEPDTSERPCSSPCATHAHHGSDHPTSFECETGTTVDDALEVEGDAVLEYSDEHADFKSLEFSPLDESVILMLREMDEGMLESTLCQETMEDHPLETIYEESDSDEHPHLSAIDLRLSSGTNSKTTAIQTVTSPLEKVQRKDDTDDTLPADSSSVTSHETRDVAGQWEGGKGPRVNSYVDILPPLVRPFSFQRRTAPCVNSRLHERDASFLPMYVDYEDVD
ncbi:hypothetical protein BDY19DRAFT_38426 [Irpex rosettiformis]|uniref:Uncharacterized protein n=1 Tax=Irpex rosettiformis TaxID=378272 RepID=A0ACB8UK48_9APHY|nr:hypothetical protein BDY19DRAFT_38426 [Irpex rosettiformis]